MNHFIKFATAAGDTLTDLEEIVFLPSRARRIRAPTYFSTIVRRSRVHIVKIGPTRVPKFWKRRDDDVSARGVLALAGTDMRFGRERIEHRPTTNRRVNGGNPFEKYNSQTVGRPV